MKSKQISTFLTLVLLLLPLIFFLAGCAAKKPLAESPETGLTLLYRLPPETGLYYVSESDIVQSVDFQGQAMVADIKQVMTFNLKPVSASEGRLTLEIIIDTLGLDTKSTMMNVSADVSNVLGKRFNMDLSDKGNELDVSGAEPIEYSIPQTGNRSIALNFQTFFPDLPEQKIKIGDRWSETDTINEVSETEEVVLVLQSYNTFEGIESVGGYECVKVVSKLNGPRNATQNAQGMTITSKGEVEGVMTWYFAYKEGLYVKSVTESVDSSTVSISGGQSFTFPMTQNMKSVTEMSLK